VDARTPERAAAALRWMANGERENKRKEWETLESTIWAFTYIHSL
jgi:hypothetical protein